MKSLDKAGLDLTVYQAKVFSESLNRTNSSSPIFIRRFMKSEFAADLDQTSGHFSFFALGDAFREINEQYGASEYGQICYEKDELYWIGYTYRYLCYTRNCPSVLAYRFLKPNILHSVYSAYHTQSEEWALTALFKKLGLSEQTFDLSARLKEALKKNK